MNTISKTDNELFMLFKENTGIHLLDSGGSSGRHWQNWQGAKLEAALVMPEGFHHYDKTTPEYSYFTLSSFHYLRKNLRVTQRAESLTKNFVKFVMSKPVGSAYYNSDKTLTEFLELVFPRTEVEGYLTYNYENFLDQDFKWYELKQGDEFEPKIIALSIHGGADIRSGYTGYVFFEANHSYWAHGITDLILECPKCKETGFISGYVDEYWQGIDNPFFNLKKGCPNCQGQLTVYTEKLEI